jgi:hypothetical protein
MLRARALLRRGRMGASLGRYTTYYLGAPKECRARYGAGRRQGLLIPDNNGFAPL